MDIYPCLYGALRPCGRGMDSASQWQRPRNTTFNPVKGKPVARIVNVAVGQLGPVARSETRTAVVVRLMALMRQAHTNGSDLIVYPELALTTFFPRWYIEDQAEIDAFFERELPGPERAPCSNWPKNSASGSAWVTLN